jgi:hypothetical protein
MSKEELEDVTKKLSDAMQSHPPKKMRQPAPAQPAKEAEPAKQEVESDSRSREQIDHIRREMESG